jgi:hypothetical protein
MKFLNSLKAFIVWARENPLWAFAWALFVTCLVFIKGFYLDSPERIGRVDSDLGRYRTYIQDYNQAIKVKQIVDGSYNSYNSIIYELNDIGGLIAQHQTVSQSQLTTAITRAQKVRQELAVSAGTLSGLTFVNDTLNPYIKTFSDNLNQRKENIDVILEFYDAVSIGDQARIDAGMSTIIYEEINLNYAPEEAKMQETINSFNRDIINYKNSMIADLNKETQTVQIFQIMTIAAKAAIAYTIVFLLVAIITLFRRSRVRTITVAPRRRHGTQSRRRR